MCYNSGMSEPHHDSRAFNPTVQQLLELHAAALAISSELDLSRLLQRIVEVARQVTHSRYAALGIVGADGLLEQFLTSGFGPTEGDDCGAAPRGHGLLGVLIREGQPLRIGAIPAHPQSVGFPAGHPPMTMLLGMPVIYRGQIVGDLYLTDKETGEMWTDEDEWLASLLASHAAVAIANAHLYRALDETRAAAEAGERQLQVLLENLPEGVVVCDAAGRVLMLNPVAQRLFGWTVGNHVTERAARVLHPDGTPYVPADLPILRTLRENVRLRAQHLVVEQPGDPHPQDIFTSTAPLHDAAGRLTGAVGVYQDITALKEVERMKDEFFSMATHELRTPLTTITMSAGLLADVLAAQGGRVSDLATLVAANAERMRRLVDDLLDLSRLEHGRLALHRRRINLGVVTDRVVEQLAPLAARKRQTLTLGNVPPEYYLDADASRIEQVLLNLVGNALKYTPEGGAIRVRVDAAGEQAVVAVQDSGPGVPPEDQPHIFERFYRSRRHETDLSPGTGLGLPIARLLVELHGGRLWYEDAPGGGSCFCFSLPME